MKVVIIGPYPLNGIRSGIKMHNYNLTKYLSQIDSLDLYLVTLGNENLQIGLDNFKVNVVKWSHLPVIDIYRLKKVILKIDPDIIHCQGTYFPYSTVASLLCNKFKVILTVHGLIQNEMGFMSGFRYLFAKLVASNLEKYSLLKISDVIICSPQIEELLMGKNRFNLNIIPNGVEIPKVSENDDLYDLKHPAILFMGVLEKIKGLDILIKAVHLIKQSKLNFHLYVAGDGPEKANYQKLVKKLDLEKNVSFVGYISNNTKKCFYKSIDIFVLPSRYESFGIVLLEAMSFKKPVIASDIGGIPSIIKHKENGLLFESENTKDLADNLTLLMKNTSLREKISLEGFKTSKSYNWETIARNTMKLYKEVFKASI